MGTVTSKYNQKLKEIIRQGSKNFDKRIYAPPIISGFYIGFTTKSGFKLIKKIESLDEFWLVINTEKSIFARHRMYPSAFFHSWTIRQIKSWLDAGWFFIARNNK